MLYCVFHLIWGKRGIILDMAQENLKKLIKMADLLEKYFLVYFLPRGDWDNNFESSENEVFKIFKKYINEDCSSFDLVKFVHDEKNYFNLLPNEIKSVSATDLISMNQEVTDNKYTSFVTVCLERLFDSKFRKEFNKKTEDFLTKEENRLKKECKLNEFYMVDVVRDYLNLCSKSYTFMLDDSNSELEKDTPVWSFEYGKEIGTRNKGDKTEKINNLYSGFKFYGHGEYSKLLIAYRWDNNKSLLELRNLGLKPITEDEKTVTITYKNENQEFSLKQIFDPENDLLESLSKQFQNRIKVSDRIKVSELNDKDEKIIENNNEKFIKIDKLLHSRFKNNYIPQELDGMYTTSDPKKTLRKEIVELLLKKGKESDESYDIWTKEQCFEIRKLFIQSIEKICIEECKTIINHEIFNNYEFKEIFNKNEAENNKKSPVSIKTMYEILLKFDKRGYLNDKCSKELLLTFKDIQEFYSKIDNNIIFTEQQSNIIKELLINVVQNIGIEKCKQITKQRLFEYYTFDELVNKDKLKKNNISIMTLFEVLQIFGSKGYLKDGRSSTINLKSWQEIKNSYALNSVSLDTPVGDDEENTVGAFIEDERIDDYEKTNLSNEIVDSLFDDNSYDSITSKFYGHDYFIDSLRSIISKFNNEDTILVFDSNNEIDRTEFVINALNSLNKSQGKLLKQEIESRKINDKQIILSRYRLLSNKNTETLSLRSFLKLDEKTCEKFWFSICFESLKGKSSNNNSWRPAVDLYKDTEPIYSMGETEIKKFIKASMTEIYNNLITWKGKND